MEMSVPSTQNASARRAVQESGMPWSSGQLPIANGSEEKGTLGISLNGVTITNVVVGGPAHQSEVIEESDEIVAVNGKPVTEQSVAQELTATNDVSSHVAVTVRKTRTKEVRSVTLQRFSPDEVACRKGLFDALSVIRDKSQQEGNSVIEEMGRQALKSFQETLRCANARDQKLREWFEQLYGETRQYLVDAYAQLDAMEAKFLAASQPDPKQQAQIQQEMSRLGVEIERERAARQTAQAELQRLRAVSQASEPRVIRVSRDDEEVSALKSQIASLQAENRSMVAEMSRGGDYQSVATKEHLAMLDAENRRLKTQVLSLQNERRELHGRMETVSRQAGIRADDDQSLASKLERLQASVDSATATSRDLARENQELRRENQELQRRAALYEEDEQEIEELRTLLSKASEEIVFNHEELMRSQAESARLKQRLTELGHPLDSAAGTPAATFMM